MAFKVDQEPLIDPVKQSKPESKFNIPVPTQIALGLATLALITAGCRPVSGGSQEPSSTPGVWEAQTNPEENIQPGIYAAQLSKEQITPEIQTAAKNGGLGEFNTLLGISAVSERPGSVPVAFHLGTTTEGHSLVIFLADGVYKILPYQVYLVSDQQGKVYFSYGIKVRGEQNKAVSFFDLYLPHLSAGEMAALTPEQIKQLVSEHLKDPNNIGAVTVDNPFDGKPPADFTVGSTQEPSLRKRLAKFFDNFSVKQALAAAAPTATVEGLGTPTAPESSTPTLEPTPTADSIPTLSPELTGGIEGIPIPSDLIIQDAFRINNFKKEEIKESYQSVDDLKGHKYLIMFDQNTMRTILIFNENLQKWDIADTGELASIAGVNFSAMLRPSQFKKAEYSSAIKKFNAIGIGTVYWRAFAPNDQIFRPSKEEYNWKYTDDTLKLAKKNNMPITSLQHLVWAKDLRLKEVDHWILSITDPEALKLEITNHIVEIANHIKNDPVNYFEENPYVLNVANTGMENNPIFSPNSKNVPIVQGVVVVNEPGYWTRDIQYYNDHAMQVIGPEYIDLAFKTAYESFPTGTMLWLNDFDMLLEDGRLKTNTPRFEKNLETIRRIRAQGIETAGLGFQLHLDAAIPISPQMEVEIRRRLQILKDENIPFSVTEMDVKMDGLKLSDDEKQRKQSEIYLWWFNILYEYGCRSFTVFGLNDSNSWYELGGNDESDPTLLDGLYRTKQGYNDLNSWFTRLLFDK